MKAKMRRMIANPRRQWICFRNPNPPPIELIIWATHGRMVTRRLFERNLIRKPPHFDTIKRLTFVDLSAYVNKQYE